jgi:hypothetical protein
MSKGEFLGMCDLTPALYLQKKEAELKRKQAAEAKADQQWSNFSG